MITTIEFLATKLDLGKAKVQVAKNLFADGGETLDALLTTTDWWQESIKIFGRAIPQPRLVAWYGEAAYSYSGLTIEPQPPTEAVERIREAVQNLTGRDFNSVLLNQYRTGSDSIGWHADDEPGVGDTIASVSFGAERRFLLRDNETKAVVAEIPLGNGDLLVMLPGVQKYYQHSVPRTAKQVGVRINLTFRQMAD